MGVVELRRALERRDLLLETDRPREHQAHRADAVGGRIAFAEQLGAPNAAEAVVVRVVGEQIEDGLRRSRDLPGDAHGSHQAPASVETTAS
jgi:hypothetical protein